MRMSAHYLDWDNRPSPFKVYRNLTSTALPREFPQPQGDSLRAIRGEKTGNTSNDLNLQVLTGLLYFSGGLTRKVRIGSETHYMRAASATGALYPIESYVITQDIPGLDAGVYHFNPFDFALVKLREGDCTPELADATAGATASSPLSIALTSLAWRNAWKYEERSYRHWFWDGGVIAANLLAICSAENLDSKILMGFVDSEVDQILGLNKEQEATVAIAALGKGGKKPAGNPLDKTHADLETEPSSPSSIDYPIIWETNKASEFHERAEVETWRHGLASGTVRAGGGPKFQFPPPIEKSPSLTEVILRRGSTRRFVQGPISLEALSTIIDASTMSIPVDFLSGNDSLIDFYFIANDVQGLPPGSYYFDRRTKSLEQLKEARLRYVSGYLCLEQLLFSDASVVFFLMTNLREDLGKLGDRGYRAAQFEAGIRAGKIYLSAYAQGIGASGSTFFDDAVTEFFSPHAESLSTMIAVGVGKPAYKARPGRILPQPISS